MIRFAWTRFRTQAAVGAGMLAIAATALLVTGIQLAHAYEPPPPPASSTATARACSTPSSRRATSRPASYWRPSASPSLA